MKSKRSRLLGILFLPLIALAVLTVFFLGSVISSIPRRASELFGPPDPNLTPGRLYYHSLVLSWQSKQLTSPTDADGGIVEFQISSGEAPAQIIRKLQQQGLIDNPSLFRTYLIYSGLDKNIQAGTYHISPAMSELEIARVFENPSPTETTLTVLPGWRAEEIASVLPDLGINIHPAQFVEVVHERQLEGYLFPDTYRVNRDVSAAFLVERLHQNFRDHVAAEIKTGLENQGFTLREGVILASIVEKEAVLPSEMPRIASVFINRLRREMPLGADPTIQYALGYNETQNTWWTNPLAISDFQVNSPYNTYQNPGLPPGPICNPGLPAIKAVAFPESTPYYYFSAACDGSGKHNFSESFGEHQEKICR